MILLIDLYRMGNWSEVGSLHGTKTAYYYAVGDKQHVAGDDRKRSSILHKIAGFKELRSGRLI